MQYGSHIGAASETVVCTIGGRGAHPVRGFPEHVNGRGRDRVCPLGSAQGRRADPLDAGPAFAQRGGRALFARACGAAVDPGRSVATRGRALGDGGRPEMQGADRRDRRNMGRSAGAGFHRDQTVGVAGRAPPDTLLVDPAGRIARSECRAQSLADRVSAVPASPGGPHIPGSPQLAGRVVPVTPSATRHMGGHP